MGSERHFELELEGPQAQLLDRIEAAFREWLQSTGVETLDCDNKALRFLAMLRQQSESKDQAHRGS